MVVYQREGVVKEMQVAAFGYVNARAVVIGSISGEGGGAGFWPSPFGLSLARNVIGPIIGPIIGCGCGCGCEDGLDAPIIRVHVMVVVAPAIRGAVVDNL
jgi:hypothetical protein